MAAEIVASIAFLAFGARNFPVPGFDATTRCRLSWQEPAVESGKNVLLGGAVRCDQFGSRSILIQSTDSGKHWQEVGTPKTGRSIAFLHSVSPKNLFAVQSHIEEGAGIDTLVRSDNSGKSWREVGDIPKGEHPNQIVLQVLKFSDSRRGNATLKLLWGNEAQVNIALATQNGGSSWQFAGAAATSAGTAESGGDATQKTKSALEPRETNYPLRLQGGTEVLLPKDVMLSGVAKTK
jgi:hypothetical protein